MDILSNWISRRRQTFFIILKLTMTESTDCLFILHNDFFGLSSASLRFPHLRKKISYEAYVGLLRAGLEVIVDQIMKRLFMKL